VGETFQVELTQATEAPLLASLATVTIVDDDTPPAFAIGNLTVVEPQSPGATARRHPEIWHPPVFGNYQQPAAWPALHQ